MICRGGKVLNFSILHKWLTGADNVVCALLCIVLSQQMMSAKPASFAESSVNVSAEAVMRHVSDSSESTEVRDTTSFAVYFRSAVSVIERGYKGNASILDAAAQSLRSVAYNRNLRIFKVYIIGAASPEGTKEFNAWLAKTRAESVKTFLRGIEPRLDDSDFVLVSRGEDWDGAARIAETYGAGSGDPTVTEIFNNNEDTEAKKLRMKRYDGGKVWREFITSYYPELRRSDVHVLFSSVQPIVPVREITSGLEVPYSDKIAPMTLLPEPAEPVEESENEKKVYYSMAVKTNLLYDLVTAVNFELEFPLGKNFSVMFEDVCPWWKWGPNDKKYCFQVWSMGVEPRWWFKRDDRRDYLTGHFAGAYGMSGKYDLQWDTKLCYQGEFWSAGLTYGYAMSVCKWMNMEFSVSAGYLSTDYRHYQPDQGYNHLYRDKYNVGVTSWFGPTKVKVSMVIPVGRNSHYVKR